MNTNPSTPFSTINMIPSRTQKPLSMTTTSHITHRGFDIQITNSAKFPQNSNYKHYFSHSWYYFHTYQNSLLFCTISCFYHILFAPNLFSSRDFFLICYFCHNNCPINAKNMIGGFQIQNPPIFELSSIIFIENLLVIVVKCSCQFLCKKINFFLLATNQTNF